MTQECLKSIFDNVVEFARSDFYRNGGINPFYILFPEDGGPISIVDMSDADFEDVDEKRLIGKSMKGIAKRLNAGAVVFITEAWVAQLGRGQKLTMPVSAFPDRTEAIVVAIEAPCFSWQAQIPIISENGRRSLGKSKKFEMVLADGIFAGFFPGGENN